MQRLVFIIIIIRTVDKHTIQLSLDKRFHYVHAMICVKVGIRYHFTKEITLFNSDFRIGYSHATFKSFFTSKCYDDGKCGTTEILEF